MKVAYNLNKQINYSNSIETINNQISNLYKEIKNLNIKLHQKEDDIKNIINEKDNIIKEMENKLLKQEKIITQNNNEISKLNNKIKEIAEKLNSEIQDKENKIKGMDNKISEMENNYLINELMNEERTFELETASPSSESNSDETENNYFYRSTIYCMLKLNPIYLNENNKNIILNLVAIGFSDNRIMIIDLLSMKVHQIIETTSTVYSLCQHNNNEKYLYCSFSNGQIIIYELKKDKYEEIQQLIKPEEYQYGEINKVITLSNGDLASAERGAISIWTKKKDENNKYEFFKEIKTEDDTCQLIEVNPYVIACAIYTPKVIKIFKRKEGNYSLVRNFENCFSHGNNSNSMAKINDNLFCSGANYFIYIVSVEPAEIRHIIEIEHNGIIIFTYSINDYLLIGQYSNIIEFKIDIDDKDNLIKPNQIKVIKNFIDQKCYALAITNKRKIFYEIIGTENKRKFILTNY